MTVAQSVLVSNKVIAGVQYTLGPGFHRDVFLEADEALIVVAFRQTKGYTRTESGEKEKTADYYNDAISVLTPKAKVSFTGRVHGTNIEGSISSTIDRDKAVIKDILQGFQDKGLITDAERHQIQKDFRILELERSRYQEMVLRNGAGI